MATPLQISSLRLPRRRSRIRVHSARHYYAIRCDLLDKGATSLSLWNAIEQGRDFGFLPCPPLARPALCNPGGMNTPVCILPASCYVKRGSRMPWL